MDLTVLVVLMASTSPGAGEVSYGGATGSGDALEAVVGGVVKGIQWIRQKYREFKVWLAEKLIASLNEGWKAALLIVGLIAVSIVVGYVWQIMMNNAIVIAVSSAIDNIGNTIAGLAAFLHVDLLITLFQLGVLVSDDLYKKLAPLYDELGSFAQELELDFSYITMFLEVDRAILSAANSFTSFGFLKTSADYVGGLSEWLKKLGKRMADYAADPQKIFTDIQEAIISQRLEDANKEVARIWAAIDFAGDWVKGKGEILVTLVNDIDSQVKNMPPAIQEAIKPWYDAAVQKVRDFERDKWDPFWKKYNTFSDAIDDQFLRYDLDIEAMQRRIDNPLDWLRSLLALPEEEQSTVKDTLSDFIGSLFPDLPAAADGAPGIIADSMAEWERANADLIALLGISGPLPEVVDISEVRMVEVLTPWYREKL